MRLLLAAELRASPRELAFEAEARGKPGLAGQFRAAGLEFNLSHSGSLALIGWAWRRAVGVDIEFWRAMHDQAALVRRCFSPAEIAAYERLPAEDRTRAFFDAWTRKEACVKALGKGLALPLRSIEVSIDENPRSLRASALPDDSRRWSLAALRPDVGASAAIVVEGDAFLILPAD